MHEVISYRGSFARFARGFFSSLFLLIPDHHRPRDVHEGRRDRRRRTWWGRVKLSLICWSSQSQ